jgi:LysM repeat protein
MPTTAPQGYWTEGKIVNGTNVGGGTFVQGTPPASYTQQVSSTSGSAAPSASVSSNPTEVYNIKARDTLGGIAKSLGVSVDSLISANGIVNPDMIYAGQTLKIPGVGSIKGSGYTPAGITGVSTGVGSGGGYINSSTPQVNADNSVAGQISALRSQYDSNGNRLTSSYNNNQKIFDDYLSKLESRRAIETANINSDYANAIATTENKQKKDLGTATSTLARIGGYLGDSASSVGYLRNINEQNRVEIANLESKRIRAITEAINAIDDKNFALAQAKVKEANDYEANINDRYNKHFEQVRSLTNDSITNERGRLDIAKTLAEQVAPLLATKLTGNNAQDFALAEQLAQNSGGKLDANTILAAAYRYADSTGSADQKEFQDLVKQGVYKPNQFLDYKAYLESIKTLGKITTEGAGIAGTEEYNDNVQILKDQFIATGIMPVSKSEKNNKLIADITTAAKETPKPEGSLVAKTTNVKPSNISAARNEALSATYNLVNKTIPELRKAFDEAYTGFIPGVASTIGIRSEALQRFENIKSQFLNQLLVANSGKVVTESEYNRYLKLLPSSFAGAVGVGGGLNVFGRNGSAKIDDLATSISNSLDSSLSNDGLAIHGYSKVKIDGQDYTVGQQIEIGDGENKIIGTVLPDGKISVQ